MSAAPIPQRVRVRMYQVGFGDCFLVTIEYASADRDGRTERHLLFDLGSTRSPRTGAVAMKDVAKLVAEHSHGQLDVLVVTHRHKDHLFGFGDAVGGPALAALAPKLVLRPWTENPELTDDAPVPRAAASAPRAPEEEPAGRGQAGAASRRFAAQLAAAQEAVLRLAARPVARGGALSDLQAAAEEQQPNQEAITVLDAMAAGDRGRYLHAGSSVDLRRVVPGLRMTVLGPPTIEQYPKVVKQVSRDQEYWMLHLQRALAAAVPPPTPKPAAKSATKPASKPAKRSRSAAAAGADLSVPPGPVRWLVEHLRDHRTHSVARLVRALDDVLNNTSLILLLEIGGLSLLFPGDAEISNWRFTLERFSDDPQLRDKLAGIDLYKVGHHGSRNATPRSLHALWAQRPPDAPQLTALMSTRPGVHGSTEATKVPRQSLIDALREVAQLHSTDDLPAGQSFVEVVADASGGPFRLVPPG